jgi:hypothetical protein
MGSLWASLKGYRQAARKCLYTAVRGPFLCCLQHTVYLYNVCIAGHIPGMIPMAAHVSPSTSPTKKSSRSESSSPTSIRPRARASSADDSSKKEVKQNREKKETIEVSGASLDFKFFKAFFFMEHHRSIHPFWSFIFFLSLYREH